MYRYETHLHSSPASKCGRYSVRDNMEFYKEIGYDGIFLTNHFIDANIGCDRTLPYEEQIEFFFRDIEEGERLADEVGIKFFWGIESSYLGTDFLIYGLSKEWYLSHPEIMEVSRRDMLTMMAENGALIVQAHPFREASYIDHVRLFPYHVHAVETDNCGNKDFQNEMARLYADTYKLHHSAGSDNHWARYATRLAGVEFETPIDSVEDFIERMKNGEAHTFTVNVENGKIIN
ncbi:MAG: PHP domain-containing protein [Clostridia bacterium]|nr:PHP domain-containing protein [Clostridia bacterium]